MDQKKTLEILCVLVHVIVVGSGVKANVWLMRALILTCFNAALGR